MRKLLYGVVAASLSLLFIVTQQQEAQQRRVASEQKRAIAAQEQVKREADEAQRAAELEASCAKAGSRHTSALAALKQKDYDVAFNSLHPCRDIAPAEVKAVLVKAMTAARERDAAVSARRLAAEKSEKRKHGVRLGMSQQDVLDSMWGRPERVNRTTTARGTREQWVYPSGNYLYFDDGVLTAIQN